MADENESILYFVNGEKIRLPVPVASVSGVLTSNGGGVVVTEDHRGKAVLVNPAHVTHALPAPKGGMAAL